MFKGTYLFICSLMGLFAFAQTTPTPFPTANGLLKNVSTRQLKSQTADLKILTKLTLELNELAGASKQRGQALRFLMNEGHDTPRFLEGLLSAPSTEPATDIARGFIDSHQKALGLSELDQVKAIGSDEDDLGQTHVRMHLFRDGLEVWPAEIMVHLDEQGRVRSFNGNYRSPGVLNTKAAIDEKKAIELALADVAPEVSHETEAALLIYDWQVEKPLLCYRVEIKASAVYPLREEVFVDAHSGRIVNRINKICTSRPELKAPVNCRVYPTLDGSVARNVSGYNDNGGIFLVNTSKPMFPGQLDANLAGTIYILDAQHGNEPRAFAGDPNGDADFNDNADTHAAGAAAYNMSLTYDWLLNTFGRNSYDGNGSALRVIVNFRQDPAAGLDNAFWDGQQLVFGDGGQITRNWAFTLDFATHELCHAITSSSANLVYQFQSGALNEAFSDMYAATQDDSNWLLGETIIIQERFGSPALRSLSDPHQGLPAGDFNRGWQPKHMDEFQNLQASADNGGVHINSGIPNHAFYKLAVAVGRADAIQIMHRTLTNYLTRNSDFSDFRVNAERAATDLFGANSAQLNALSQALSEVGIGAAPQNPGTEAASTLYYPFTGPFEIAGESFQNLFYVANPSAAPVTGTITWYDANGTPVSSTDFGLNPHNSGYGSTEANGQWIKVEASGPIIGAYQHMNANGTSWSLAPATPFINNGMYVPHIATNTQKFWTVGAAANVRDTPSSVYYVDNFDQLYTLDINQFGQGTAFSFEDAYGTYPDVSSKGGLWGFFLNYDLEQEKVLDFNMTGVEIFGRKDVSQAAGLVMDATSGRSLIFTHVAADTNLFWTGYSVVNLSAESASISIVSYDNQGRELARNIQTLAPFGKLLRVTGDSLVPTGTSWFIVSGLSETTQLAGMELFGSTDDQQLAGFQASPFVSNKIYFPFVISGVANRPEPFANLNNSFTGISVVNPNSAANNITVRVYDSQGNLSGGTITLPPYSKLLGTIQNLLGITDFYGYVEVEGSLPIAGFSLSGFFNQQEWAANPMVFTQ